VLLSEFEGRFPGDLLELFVKIGDIFISALETDLVHVVVGLDKHLMGMPYSYFIQELDDRFIRPAFEIPAERSWRHVGDTRYLFKFDLISCSTPVWS
jgi:hypothetical protein